MTPIQQIERTLSGNDKGITIQKIMDETGLARGTVKTYLEELIGIGRVHEEIYAQNVKVYFLNGVGKFQHQVQMSKDGVLFVDVMTDPWKKPFLRIKYKNNGNQGAIFLNNEESINKLIGVLSESKPQFKKYREMISKLEQNN